MFDYTSTILEGMATVLTVAFGSIIPFLGFVAFSKIATGNDPTDYV